MHICTISNNTSTKIVFQSIKDLLIPCGWMDGWMTLLYGWYNEMGPMFFWTLLAVSIHLFLAVLIHSPICMEMLGCCLKKMMDGKAKMRIHFLKMRLMMVDTNKMLSDNKTCTNYDGNAFTE